MSDETLLVPRKRFEDLEAEVEEQKKALAELTGVVKALVDQLVGAPGENPWEALEISHGDFVKRVRARSGG